jgi:hypothetical protein
MAQKKPPRASKKKATARPKSPRGKTITSQSLRLATKQADVLGRRAAQEYVEQGLDLEQARVARQEADRALGLFCAAEAAKAKRPFYNFLAQGDSWFTYDCGIALIPFLKDFFGNETAYFENIAASGRTLRTMMSRDFKDALAAGPGNAQPWNGVLLSGGGNDICGDHRFRDWLKPYDGGNSPEEYITTAFDNELSIIQGLYEEALDLVASSTQGVRLFVHDYDFAIPDNRCVTGWSKRSRSDVRFCFAGPWLWPAFDDRGFHKAGGDRVPQLTRDIVVVVLKRFAAMLARLELKYPRQICVVRTQGVLTPIQTTRLWANELHPQDESFKALAKRFYEKLRAFT